MKHDIFALLDENRPPDPAHGSVPVLSLWPVATHYLMFFTKYAEQFASHFDEEERSYLCLGDDCPACAAKVKTTEHIYLPVWDAQNRRVAVLKFDNRPDGPSEKVLTFLRTYRDRLADVVAVVACKGRGEFTITAHEPLPETDRGALACQDFCKGLESGAINLRDYVKRLSREEMAQLKSVRHLTGSVVGKPVAPGLPPALAGRLVQADTATPPPEQAGQPSPPAPDGQEV